MQLKKRHEMVYKSLPTRQRLLRALPDKNGLKPHVVKKFKLSNDPEFEKKFWDVIGFYLDPPAKALVLCCDEKSQCQALERTQLGLPLAPKRPRTMTHDYTPAWHDHVVCGTRCDERQVDRAH